MMRNMRNGHRRNSRSRSRADQLTHRRLHGGYIILTSAPARVPTILDVVEVTPRQIIRAIIARFGCAHFSVFDERRSTCAVTWHSGTSFNDYIVTIWATAGRLVGRHRTVQFHHCSLSAAGSICLAKRSRTRFFSDDLLVSSVLLALLFCNCLIPFCGYFSTIDVFVSLTHSKKHRSSSRSSSTSSSSSCYLCASV